MEQKGMQVTKIEDSSSQPPFTSAVTVDQFEYI
jgi:hypothetical protein